MSIGPAGHPATTFMQGREVQKLVNRLQTPGRYRVDLHANGLPSGVYFYRLQVVSAMHQRKMLLMR